MTADVLKAVSEGGSMALLALVLFFVAWYGNKFLNRLLDHLDAGVRAQNEVAGNLKVLCDHFNNRIDAQGDNIRDQATDAVQAWKELSNQLAAQDKRAEDRHRQQMIQADQRHQQQLEHADERHTKLIQVLRELERA